MILLERLVAMLFVLGVCYWIYRSAWIDRWVQSRFIKDTRQAQYIREEAARLKAEKEEVAKALEAKKKRLVNEVKEVGKIKL